jgi:hypothetical protein
MWQYTRHLAAPAFAAMLLAVAACSRGDDDNGALSDDTTLSRDLARVGADSLAQPQLQDVPPAQVEQPPAVTPEAPPPAPKTRPRPSQPKNTAKNDPSPTKSEPPPVAAPAKDSNTVTTAPAGSERPLGTIPAGTTLMLDAADKVCTNTNKVGDRFTATVSTGVTGENGAAIPAGATVTLEVTKLKRSENARDNIEMGFRVVSVAFDGKSYAMDADVQTATIDKIRASSTGNDAKKVLGGAVAGAIIGQVLGKDKKGTLIGAAAGAAAGGAAAAATANYEGCVSVGGDIVVKLNDVLTVAKATN